LKPIVKPVVKASIKPVEDIPKEKVEKVEKVTLQPLKPSTVKLPALADDESKPSASLAKKTPLKPIKKTVPLPKPSDVKMVDEEVEEKVEKKEVKKLVPLAKKEVAKKEVAKAAPLPVKKITKKTVAIAKKGVEEAELVEEEAVFQVGLATISARPNLPGMQKKKRVSPQIRIPKISITGIKASPNRNVVKQGVFDLPEDATIIPKVSVVSPSSLKYSKTKEKDEDATMIENINSIELNKLIDGRTGKNVGGYAVADLKVIAGSLGLSKTGNKAELVSRIKTTILKYKPNAFDK